VLGFGFLFHFSTRLNIPPSCWEIYLIRRYKLLWLNSVPQHFTLLHLYGHQNGNLMLSAFWGYANWLPHNHFTSSFIGVKTGYSTVFGIYHLWSRRQGTNTNDLPFGCKDIFGITFSDSPFGHHYIPMFPY